MDLALMLAELRGKPLVVELARGGRRVGRCEGAAWRLFKLGVDVLRLPAELVVDGVAIPLAESRYARCAPGSADDGTATNARP